MRINALEHVKKHKYIRYTFLIAVLLLSGAAWHLLVQRPTESIGTANKPGEGSVEVYSSRIVTQHVRATTSTVSGVAFILSEKDLLPPDNTPIIIRVLSVPDNQVLQIVQKTFGEIYHHEKIGSVVHVNFPFIRHTKNGSYAISIQAPNLTKNLPLKIAYQIDDTKYTDGDLFINKHNTLGSLGFLLYEQPTLLIRILRWMSMPEHVLIWAGIALSIMGSILLTLRIPKPKQLQTEPQSPISSKEIFVASILTVLAVFIIFQPALSLFFFQDDIPILLRVKNMSSWTELIFTNHPYLPHTVLPDYGIGFYRPISYSLYPWIMYHLFGLSAPAHHAVHLLLFATLAVLIYILSRRFGPPLFASITMGFWLVHSSKLSTAYWLSSSQDILSSLFFLSALIFYIRHRTEIKKRSMKVVWLLYILALFSKDFSILLPCIVLLFELYARIQRPLGSWKAWVMAQVRTQAPFIVISGLYIIIRTIALGDPTLPDFPYHDHSYDIAFNIHSIAQNIIAYTHWTAEYFLWPQSTFLNSFMLDTRVPGPFYPGLVLLTGYVASIIIFWKRKNVRVTLLFAGAWWVILLLPNLLMIHERNDRWLTLPLWGSTLALTLIPWQCIPSKPWVQKSIEISVLVGLCIYGIWIARLPSTLGPYETISTYARATIVQYRESNPLEAKLFFKTVPEDMRGTINPDLLLLFSNDTPTHL